MGHGVDSEPSGWVTDYALMTSLFVFAASLRKRGAAPWAVRTQAFMACGYLVGALGHPADAVAAAGRGPGVFSQTHVFHPCVRWWSIYST